MELKVGDLYLYNDGQDESFNILIYKKPSLQNTYIYFDRLGWVLKNNRMVMNKEPQMYGIAKERMDKFIHIDANYEITKERLYFDFVFKYNLSEQIVK